MASPPEEVRTGQSLTAGPDLLNPGLFNYSVDRSPDFFGLAPPQRIIGIDAKGGNDDLLLTGSGIVDGRLSQTRIYANLPIDPADADAVHRIATYPDQRDRGRWRLGQ